MRDSLKRHFVSNRAESFAVWMLARCSLPWRYFILVLQLVSKVNGVVGAIQFLEAVGFKRTQIGGGLHHLGLDDSIGVR